ncbi:MAG: cysteine desulfurase [Micavibrio sp.]|nr:cysteine desulfurase [Micavibrio sp.]
MPIYLDYNATSPIRISAAQAYNDAQTLPLNASSVHGFGRKGRMIIEGARDILAAGLGVPSSQIIFNSGATEGNNTVLKSFSGETILASAIEHPCVIESAPHTIKIPVTANGTIDLGTLEVLLKEHKPALVSIMAVNNETGAIQPIKEAASLAHSNGALFHCDAVQAFTRVPLNMDEMGIDFLTISAHKIGGAQGVGALALRLCGITPVLLHGGGQEKSARAGTENVAGIASFGAAAKEALENMNTENTRLKYLQNKLENALSNIDGVTTHAQSAPRVANTTLFSLAGASSETLLMALDLDGLAVSNGSACSSGRVQSSYVLDAMGIDANEAKGTLRVSSGWNTSESDIDAFIQAFTKIAGRMRN